MKILHTADWHLGKKLESFSRLEEQKAVLDEICGIANDHDVDVVVIAGDLFDTFNPPVEAVDLFYETLKRLSHDGGRAVVAIAGNHDSPERIEAPDPLARECGIIFSGFPNTQHRPFTLKTGLSLTQAEEGFVSLEVPGIQYPLRLLLTPYANEHRLKKFLGMGDSDAELRKVLQENWSNLAEKYCDDKGVNLLIAHLYLMHEGGKTLAEPEGEKPILYPGGAQAIYTTNIPEQIQYVALGHLHQQNLVYDQPCPVLYSGSPIAYSFSEAEQDKYVIITEIEPAKPAKWKTIKLTKGKKLLRKKFFSVKKAVEWMEQNPGCLLELTMTTNTYLTAQQRKALYATYDGIVTLIPDVWHTGSRQEEIQKSIDLEKNIEDLFIDYFNHKQNQPPSKELISLFREVLGVDEEE